MPRPTGLSRRGLTTTRTNCSINESSLARSTARSPTALRYRSRLIKSRRLATRLGQFQNWCSPARTGGAGLHLFSVAEVSYLKGDGFQPCRYVCVGSRASALRELALRLNTEVPQWLKAP